MPPGLCPGSSGVPALVCVNGRPSVPDVAGSGYGGAPAVGPPGYLLCGSRGVGGGVSRVEATPRSAGLECDSRVSPCRLGRASVGRLCLVRSVSSCVRLAPVPPGPPSRGEGVLAGPVSPGMRVTVMSPALTPASRVWATPWTKWSSARITSMSSGVLSSFAPPVSVHPPMSCVLVEGVVPALAPWYGCPSRAAAARGIWCSGSSSDRLPPVRASVVDPSAARLT